MRYFLLLLLNLFLFASFSVSAGEVTKSVAREGVRAAFEEFERQMIYKYFDQHSYESDHDYNYGDNHKEGKKGKKKDLPPGIQKKLARGGTLPPGIAKQYLPNDLHRELPPPPYGYERVIHGNDVLLVEIDTGLIADIVVDAVLGD